MGMNLCFIIGVKVWLEFQNSAGDISTECFLNKLNERKGVNNLCNAG